MASQRPGPFDESGLLAEARQKSGLEDFGDEAFRQPLGVLLASLAQAPLHAAGTRLLRRSILRSLVRRLRAQDCFARHPEIAEERIEQPLVVVGMMRSGTTLVQRLLARDPRFYVALGWEVDEPAPRPGSDWLSADPRIPDAVAASERMRALAPELHAIHPSDALEPEEEILFLADAFLSHVPEASCHVPHYRRWLDRQDFAPAYRHLRRMLQLLQWQKRRRGEPRERWLLKTPAHLGYLDTLLSEFPDARVIHVHRDPIEVIPSGASLNWTLWRMHADDVDPAEVGRQWLERMAWATRRALAVRDRLPDEDRRFVDSRYRRVTEDPIGAVEAVYDALGLTLSREARSAMQAWLRADRSRPRPAHRYSADRFGLSDEQIGAAFAPYIVRFLGP